MDIPPKNPSGDPVRLHTFPKHKGNLPTDSKTWNIHGPDTPNYNWLLSGDATSQLAINEANQVRTEVNAVTKRITGDIQAVRNQANTDKRAILDAVSEMPSKLRDTPAFQSLASEQKANQKKIRKLEGEVLALKERLASVEKIASKL